jgi:PAS domain-containing protein
VWLRLRGSAVIDAKGRVSAIVLLLHDVTMAKRVTHTLDSCETTLQFIAKYSSDPIIRFDRNLVCVSANPSLLRALDRDEREVVGKSLRDLDEEFRPNDRFERFLRQSLSSGQPHSFDLTFGPVGGSVRTYLLPEPSPEFLPETVLAILRAPVPVGVERS